MIDGTNYYSTDSPVSVEVDKDLMKYTTSYAEDGIPQKDGRRISIEMPELLCRS